MKLLYCTTNQIKFNIADQTCKLHGIELEQFHVDVDEIQSNDPRAILTKKIQDIFAIVKNHS